MFRRLQDKNSGLGEAAEFWLASHRDPYSSTEYSFPVAATATFTLISCSCFLTLIRQERPFTIPTDQILAIILIQISTPNSIFLENSSPQLARFGRPNLHPLNHPSYSTQHDQEEA